MYLIIVETKDGGTAEQRIIHVDITGIVVCVRVPQTSGSHPDPLSSLFSDDDLDHNLVSVVTQSLHLALDVVSDCFGPLWDFAGVVDFAPELLIQTSVDYLLEAVKMSQLYSGKINGPANIKIIFDFI